MILIKPIAAMIYLAIYFGHLQLVVRNYGLRHASTCHQSGKNDRVEAPYPQLHPVK